MLIQQDQRTIITQRIDPKLIVANTILQFSSMELEQSIEAELLENPALVTLEENGCDGNCLSPVQCPACMARENMRRHEEREGLDSGDHQHEYESSSGFDFGENEQEFDLVGNLEAEVTLAEHLCGLLRAAVPPEDYRLGEYLINCLDERGWLREKTGQIACEANVPESEICRLLVIIQSFDPPGVGARDIQECLLIQLAFLREEIDPAQRRFNTIATRLLKEQFENVCNNRYAKIARVLKLTMEEVEGAIAYIRERLNPFPASQFRPPWGSSPSHSKSSVRADVIIRRTEFGYEIDVPQLEPYALSINPHYREAYTQIKNGERYQTPEDRKHFIEWVERAERFIQNLHQRRQTLRFITRCIVECQTGFLETGSVKFLRPLTRTRIANMLGVHESTVSRATANKYVQLPNQEVVGFDIFFNSSLSIKEAIETLILEEDAASPLSDQQIVDILQERGISVARRTVVKYRSEAKILSSTRRRR